jgi:hypothetical protein
LSFVVPHVIPAKAGIHRQCEAWIPAFAHCCPGKVPARLAKMAKTFVIPAEAGRSAQRGEHPQDGPGGVSEANHPATYKASKALDPSFRWDDGSVALNFLEKLPRAAHFF